MDITWTSSALGPPGTASFAERSGPIGDYQETLGVDESCEVDKFAEAMQLESAPAFKRGNFDLYAFCAVGFLCSVMHGYSGSLLDGLLQNEAFKDFFDGSNTGIWVGVVASIYQIGSIASIPLVGPALDVWGRPKGILIGACAIIFGTVLQGNSYYGRSLKLFMAGRFFSGFGANIIGTGAPIYVIELCHPAHRGVITALFNSFWFVGSILSGGAVRGALNLSGNQTWLLPVWLQLVCSVSIATLTFFLPESPRWLFVRGQKDRAWAFIERYHGHSKPDNKWVLLQKREFESLLNPSGTDRSWWNYSALFRTPASRYRLLCNILVNVFGQWTGNALVGLLLSAVLDTAGITNQIDQTNLHLGFACLQLVMATAGSFLVDTVGRRPMLILSNTALAAIWVCMAIVAANYEGSASAGSARAVVALIVLFDIIFATGITPLQVLYPVEVMAFETRAKGLAFGGLSVNVAGLVNQFAWSIAMAKIGWKTYIIAAVWCLVQALVIYVIIPETRKCTLEQLDVIFGEKNPRKASVARRRSLRVTHTQQWLAMHAVCVVIQAAFRCRSPIGTSALPLNPVY